MTDSQVFQLSKQSWFKSWGNPSAATRSLYLSLLIVMLIIMLIIMLITTWGDGEIDIECVDIIDLGFRGFL